jgi:cellobiose-specific phosphotransferase system component IIB
MEEMNAVELLVEKTQEACTRKILDVVVNAATKDEAEKAIRLLLKDK